MNPSGEHGTKARLLREALADDCLSSWCVGEHLKHWPTKLVFHPHEDLFIQLPAAVRAMFGARRPEPGRAEAEHVSAGL